jgi:LysR family transcriptional regulator, glycine cleavage system transcriptional activator
VRLTLTPSFASQWLMPRLRDFWRTHPDIPLSLHPEPRLVDLRREGMDLGIRYGNGDWPGVEARRLTSARLIIAGAPEVAKRAGTRPAEMALLPWVATSEDWPEQINWLKSVGIPTGAISRTTFPSEELAIAAAREGMGLIAESHALLEEDLRSGRLVMTFDGKGDLPAYFVVTPPGPARKPVRAFLRWLAQAA